MIGMIIVGARSQHHVGLPLADQAHDRAAVLQRRHQFAVMDVEQLAGLEASQRMSLLLRRVSHRLALQYAPQVQNRPLEERVAAATEFLHADGGFAEWEKTDRGYEIRDYNCVFSSLGGGNGAGCEWHLNFLRWLLGAEVRAEPVEGCANCCRCVIESEAAADRSGALDGRLS